MSDHKFDVYKYAAYAIGLEYKGQINGQHMVWDPILQAQVEWNIERDSLFILAKLHMSIISETDCTWSIFKRERRLAGVRMARYLNNYQRAVRLADLIILGASVIGRSLSAKEQITSENEDTDC